MGHDPPTQVKWLRRLCLGIVTLAGLGFAVATIGVQIRQPASRRVDFDSYYLAGGLAREHRSPYDAAALAERGRALGLAHEPYPFLYPPPFALAMQPFAWLAYPHARQAWMLLCTAALCLALATTALLLRRQAAALGVQDPCFFWLLLSAFVPAALDSTSVQNDIRAGSVGILLFLALVVAVGSMQQRRAGTAGVALAAATVVKLAPGVLFLYAWWRGERRAVLIGAALLALSLLATWEHWGGGILADYVRRTLLPTLATPNGWAHNQSLDAFLLRLFDPSALAAVPARAPLLQRALSAVLTLALAAATLRGLAVRRRCEPGLVPVEFGLVVLAMLIAMKVTWAHTLAAMLFVWPALMLSILRAAEREVPWARRAGLAACAGFFLSSAHLPVLWGDRLQQLPWLAFTGAHVLGLLVLWATSLFVLRHRTDILGA